MLEFKKNKYKNFIWKPQEDITPYELAMCLKLLIGSISGIRDLSLVFDELPDNCKRHIEAILNEV